MTLASISYLKPAQPLAGCRVFADARMMSYTGIGTHILEHLRGLSRLGAHITATVLNAHDADLLSELVPNVRSYTTGVGVYSVAERLRSFAVPRHICEQDAHWFPQYNVPFCLPRHSLVTVHDIIQFRYNLNIAHRFAGVAGRLVLFRAIEQADRVICPSVATRNDLLDFAGERGYHAEMLYRKTRVIRNGVSLRWSVVPPESHHNVARLVGSSPYLLCVGNGKPHKNFRLLFSLAERLATEGFPHILVIVGPQDRYLMRFLTTYGTHSSHRILPVGKVDDSTLAGLYANASVLLTPSLYEGFGLPPLEGMMAGTPVVASNRGGLPESVGRNQTGALIDPLDLDAWHREVVRLLTDGQYRAQRVECGRQWAAKMEWEPATLALAEEIIAVAGGSAQQNRSRS